MIPDDILWAEVRETAAVTGWADKALVIDTTVERLTGPDATDEARETLRGQLDRLWIERMTDYGVA